MKEQLVELTEEQSYYISEQLYAYDRECIFASIRLSFRGTSFIKNWVMKKWVTIITK